MKNYEFEQLKAVEEVKEAVLTSNSLINKEDRTLLYGYTCDRETWHVYIENNQIHTVKYKSQDNPHILSIKTNEDYVPNKRLYPAKCDLEFCSLLKQKGIRLPFTTWENNVEEKQYYGKII